MEKERPNISSAPPCPALSTFHLFSHWLLTLTKIVYLTLIHPGGLRITSACRLLLFLGSLLPSLVFSLYSPQGPFAATIPSVPEVALALTLA